MLHKRQELGPDYWRPNGLAKHTLVAPDGLIHCDDVVDIGAGLRPMQWYTPKSHLCVDAFVPYRDKLEEAGYSCWLGTAKAYLSTGVKHEAIYLLDVIEHMEKEEGQEVVKLALKAATVQIVVFTPKGFMEQNEDAWGYGGHYWQTHRSGWTKDDFPDWRFQSHVNMFFASYDVQPA